jgi:hypothetical protein
LPLCSIPSSSPPSSRPVIENGDGGVITADAADDKNVAGVPLAVIALMEGETRERREGVVVVEEGSVMFVEEDEDVCAGDGSAKTRVW